MDKTTNSAINEYTKLVQEHYKNLAAAYVFGSYAKNTAHQDSDIDLALIFEHLEQVERFDLQVKLMLLASEIDTSIEPHPLSKEDFYSDNPFAAEIRKTGHNILETAF